MTNQWARRLASILVAILLFVYIGYQIYNANYSSVRTETVLDATEADTIQANGVAIRNEILISNDQPGVVAFTLTDGSKVAKDGTVADLYRSEQEATAQQQLKALDEQIQRLQNLNKPGNTYAVDQADLNRQIDQNMIDLLAYAEKADWKEYAEMRADLLYSLNERQLVTAQITDFTARIEALSAQRDALAASGAKTGSILSPASGYFISKTDGWESTFDYNSLRTLSAEELSSKLEQSPSAPGKGAGKICAGYDWYFAALVTAKDAIHVKDAMENGSGQVFLSFPFVTSQRVPATVAAINQSDEKGNACVLFVCNQMNEELARLRKATAKIQLTSYQGLRVSQKAIRFETLSKEVKGEDGEVTTITQNVMGVYVMHGNEIEFRQIVPLHSMTNYVICDPSPDPDTLMTSTTVKLYDEVVVEGTDLFDGKVIK